MVGLPRGRARKAWNEGIKKWYNIKVKSARAYNHGQNILDKP